MSKALEVYRGELTKFQDHFQRALPVTARKYMTPERLTRVVLNALSRQPMLMKCTPTSILKATMDCVQVGLEPGGPLGHAYFVPFRNKHTGNQEAQAIIGYKGFINLAKKSGYMKGQPYANLVYEADTFELDIGSGQPPRHMIDHRKVEDERGNVLGAYCVAHFNDGGTHVEWMDIKAINKIRDRSRAKEKGPWVTDWGMMARKTVLRRAKNFWPLSSEMADAFRHDDAIDTGEAPDPSLVYDASFVEDLEKAEEQANGPEPGKREFGFKADKKQQETTDEPPKKVPLKEKMELIAGAQTLGTLDELAQGDDRKTILDAIEKRRGDLNENRADYMEPPPPTDGDRQGDLL